jgi:polysaccharide pyruvyl transferase WcaK-like protein
MMTIHHVFANKSNIGDWLSALGIQKFLHSAHVEEHFCDRPFVPETLERLSSTTSDDLIIIGGGGLFMDYFEPFWSGLRDLELSANICIWGVGYCDLKNEKSHPPLDVLLDLVRACSVCVVRDRLSHSYLAANGAIEVVPCPSLAAVGPSPGGWGVLHVDNYTTVGKAAFDVMDVACRKFAEESGRPYRRTNNRISRTTELESVLSLYKDSDLIVSSALHGCIIPVAMGKPVIAVSGDRKIEAFMEAAGLLDWVLDAAEVENFPQFLRDIHGQNLSPEFVNIARSQNAVIGEVVRAHALGALG